MLLSDRHAWEYASANSERVSVLSRSSARLALAASCRASVEIVCEPPWVPDVPELSVASEIGSVAEAALNAAALPIWAVEYELIEPIITASVSLGSSNPDR